jgi:tetrahydromethanopterin S-methyltransferase subunit G
MADNNEIFDLITKMYSEMQQGFDTVNNEIKSITSRLDSVESKVDKNTLILEKLQTNIKTVAEVQESFSEQLGRSTEKSNKTISERLEIIEMAVTHTSKSVTYLAGAVDIVKSTTASNDIDIKILKRLQNNPSM